MNFLPARAGSLLLAVLLMPALARSTPIDLRCEGTKQPAGVDVAAPRLSWVLGNEDPAARGVRQTAYQILVASSSEKLARDEGDLWDTGRIASDRFGAVDYAGKPLASGQRVYWKARTWEATGNAAATESPYSAAATWTMGLLKPDDWQAAQWIGIDKHADVPAEAMPTPRSKGKPPALTANVLLRRDFTVESPLARATLFVSGLGHYEAMVNGEKIGDDLMSPGWTDYHKTVLYDTFDVTDRVRNGANRIGLTLGNGIYHIEPAAGAHKGRYVKFTNSYGPQKAIALLRLDFADGSTRTVKTDESWQAMPGPITYSNFFGGEDFVARTVPKNWASPAATAADPRWNTAALMAAPGGALRGLSAAAPPIKAIAEHRPVSSRELRPDVTVYDLGQNASHMVRLNVSGPAMSSVRVIPAELLAENGYVDRKSATQDAGGPAWWQYTLAGEGSETYMPKFFYQGCRYLQVERFPATPGGELPSVEEVVGVVVHSSAEPIGTFETSNELFNKIHALVRWAQRSNMMSLMTDCPHREKLGWLEELHLNGPSLRYNYRLDRLYAKAMNDMADAQLDVGLVPNIAPEYFLAHTDKLTDNFRNSPEWGSAFIIAAWQQYLFTGDDALLRTHYDAMKRYHAFLASQAKGEIISVGLGDWYDLGPKPPWGSQLTPPPFTATAIYYYDTLVLADVAKLFGKTDEAAAFTEKAKRIRVAFNERFYDAKAKRYATGSQCTSAMPLVLGLVEEANRADVLQALIDDIRARGNALSAGDVGYRYVLRALADAGRSDVIFEMNNQTERPGYGMQIARGATALTEKWDASVGNFGSQNHFMLGQINEWFFHDLGGIQMVERAPGFEQIVIRPALVGDLTHANISYNSVRGKIVSNWTNAPTGLTLNVTIPPGTTATVHVPASDADAVREGDGLASKARGVKFLRAENGAAVYEVGSGNYAFASSMVPTRPTGLAAVAGNGTVTLKWTPVANADHYVVTRLDDGQPRVINGDLKATTLAESGLTNSRPYRYAVRAVNAIGESVASEVEATPDVLVNASFETPSVKAEQYAPAGAGWTFTPLKDRNGSGVAANRGGFTEKNAAAPHGVQCAFLQGVAELSQPLGGLTPGTTYTLSFRAAQRGTYNKTGQTWRVVLDDKPVAEFAPEQAAMAWTEYAATFTATAATHALRFVGTNARGGDNTVLIDDVRLREAAK